MKRYSGFSFSQTGLDGIKPGENTQGSVTADPTAAYTLVLSMDGWTIPVREKKSLRPSAVNKDETNSLIYFSTLLLLVPFTFSVADARPSLPL